jgi:hypothetical protein
MPKYPNIHVKLVGEDGNAFAILGRCRKAMMNAGLSQEEFHIFYDEATSGNYDNLLVTVMNWFETE